MTNSNSKGTRREREIIVWLDEHGWAVIRAPASGAATDRELPDLLAGNGDRFIAAEVKASEGAPIYLDAEEVDALRYFAESFGAEPQVAVKFDTTHGDPAWGADRPGFYFIHVDDLYQTDGGNYRVKKETAEATGVPEVAL